MTQKQCTPEDLKQLDPMLMLAGLDGIITHDEMQMLLKHANSVGIPELTAQQYIVQFAVIKNWTFEDVNSKQGATKETQQTTSNKASANKVEKSKTSSSKGIFKALLIAVIIGGAGWASYQYYHEQQLIAALAAQDEAAWQAAESINTVESYQHYLKIQSAGKYIELAEKNITTLQQEQLRAENEARIASLLTQLIDVYNDIEKEQQRFKRAVQNAKAANDEKRVFFYEWLESMLNKWLANVEIYPALENITNQLKQHESNEEYGQAIAFLDNRINTAKELEDRLSAAIKIPDFKLEPTTQDVESVVNLVDRYVSKETLNSLPLMVEAKNNLEKTDSLLRSGEFTGAVKLLERVDYLFESKNFTKQMVIEIRKDREEKNKEFMVNNQKKEGVYTTSSGLQYSINFTSDKPRRNLRLNDKVTFICIIEYLNGINFDHGRVKTIVNDLPDGLREGLQLMTVSSEYTFFIPPHLSKNGYLPTNDMELGNLKKGHPNDTILSYTINIMYTD